MAGVGGYKVVGERRGGWGGVENLCERYGSHGGGLRALYFTLSFLITVSFRFLSTLSLHFSLLFIFCIILHLFV